MDGAWQRHLFNGKCQIIVQASSRSGQFRFEARGEELQTGSTDIYTVRPGTPVADRTPVVPDAMRKDTSAAGIGAQRLVEKGKEAGTELRVKKIGKMLGADISFLPQLEEQGIKFSDKGVQRDAISSGSRSMNIPGT